MKQALQYVVFHDTGISDTVLLRFSDYSGVAIPEHTDTLWIHGVMYRVMARKFEVEIDIQVITILVTTVPPI